MVTPPFDGGETCIDAVLKLPPAKEPRVAHDRNHSQQRQDPQLRQSSDGDSEHLDRQQRTTMHIYYQASFLPQYPSNSCSCNHIDGASRLEQFILNLIANHQHSIRDLDQSYKSAIAGQEGPKLPTWPAQTITPTSQRLHK